MSSAERWWTRMKACAHRWNSRKSDEHQWTCMKHCFAQLFLREHRCSWFFINGHWCSLILGHQTASTTAPLLYFCPIPYFIQIQGWRDFIIEVRSNALFGPAARNFLTNLLSLQGMKTTKTHILQYIPSVPPTLLTFDSSLKLINTNAHYSCFSSCTFGIAERMFKNFKIQWYLPKNFRSCQNHAQ